VTGFGVFVLVLVGLAAAALAKHALRAEARRRATPRELRGDWWARFEDDFRRYAASTRPPHRRNEGGNRPGQRRLREPRGDG
jgi:hypothetical protein